MTTRIRQRISRTTAALVAVMLVLTVLGPVGTVAAAPGVDVTQTPSSTTVAPGDTVEITTTVNLDDIDSASAAIDADLPAGWEIVDYTSDAPTYKKSEYQWLWFASPTVSGDKTVTYTVQVPDDATSRSYTVSGIGSGSVDGEQLTTTAATTITVAEEQPNAVPAADAGNDQTVDEGDEVTLNAASSSDADGSVASYSWTQTDGPSVSLSDSGAAQPTFTAPAVDASATLTFEVTVTDDEGATSTDTVTVTVENADQPVDTPTETPDDTPTDTPDDNTPTDTPSSAVSLQPADDLVAVGDSATYDIVLEDADGGVGAYSTTVTIDDPSVASITDVELNGFTSDAMSDIQISEDGSSVTIDALVLDSTDDGPVTLGTVTVETTAEGTTRVSLSVSELGNEAAAPYEVTTTTGATLEASTLIVGDSDTPAQDLDGDGDHEDVNGDGSVDMLDVQTLFADRNGQTVTNSPAAFDYNGNGEFSLLDILALFVEETG